MRISGVITIYTCEINSERSTVRTVEKGPNDNRAQYSTTWTLELGNVRICHYVLKTLSWK